MNCRIIPSVLAADYANLQRDLQRIGNADAVHVDVMDGRFVPNTSFGLPLVARMAEVSPLPLDVHLMVLDPERWAPEYARLRAIGTGVESITFHFEATADPVALARKIRGLGVRAAIALKPATPAGVLAGLLREFDTVLVMTVEPGFGGQSFLPETLPKLGELREAARFEYDSKTKHLLRLQVDGGINQSTIARAAAAGAQDFVAGSAVFAGYNSPENAPAKAVAELRRLAFSAAEPSSFDLG